MTTFWILSSSFFFLHMLSLENRISKSSQLILFGRFVTCHLPIGAHLSLRTHLLDRSRSWRSSNQDSIRSPAASGPAGIMGLVFMSSELSLAL